MIKLDLIIIPDIDKIIEDTNKYINKGHLECLKYAHENGCHLNKYICETAAARGGHLDCLEYAHKNGCPCDENHVRKLLEEVI